MFTLFHRFTCKNIVFGTLGSSVYLSLTRPGFHACCLSASGIHTVMAPREAKQTQPAATLIATHRIRVGKFYAM